MSKKFLQKAINLALSVLLSISGWGICPQNQVARADEIYFESRTIQDSNQNYTFDETNDFVASSQAIDPQSVVTNDAETGAFDVSGGTYGETADYHFDGTTEQGGVLYIHPKSSETSIKIENKDKSAATKDRIEITEGPEDTDKAVNITLNGVNIDTSSLGYSGGGAALKIKDDADFNVNILLADGSENSLVSYGYYAGLQKNGVSAVGTLTISGTTVN